MEGRRHCLASMHVLFVPMQGNGDPSQPGLLGLCASERLDSTNGRSAPFCSCSIGTLVLMLHTLGRSAAVL